MKILLHVLFLPFSFGLYGQKIVLKNEHELFKGMPSIYTIDKSGGHIYSSDKMLEVIIPEGAVTKKTIFKIEPEVPKMELGFGNTYKMEPEGVLFKKPLQVIFHYEIDDSEKELESLLGIAIRDNKGQWFKLRSVTINPESKTISGYIRHFSSLSGYKPIFLVPGNDIVKVNKTLSLRLIMEQDDDNQGDEELLPLHYENYDLEAFLALHNPVWYVNGVVNGNSTWGIVRPTGRSTSEFTAPAEVPDQNPVNVSVQLNNLKVKGKNISNTRLSSRLLIFDDLYQVEINAHMKLTPAGSNLGEVLMSDMGFLLIEVKKNSARIKRIYNTDGVLNYTGARCSYVIKQPGKGLVHISGIKTIKVTPSDPPAKPNAKVEIEFETNQMAFPFFEIRCPEGTIPMGGPFFSRAYPMYFSFLTKEGEQIVHEVGNFGGDHWVRIKVYKITGTF